MNDVLIIFARNPVKGKVKTRIAAESSPEFALRVYQDLLQETLETAREVPVRRLLFFSDDRPRDPGLSSDFEIHTQNGKDLGERMKNAFDVAFSYGARRVVIIGADCPALTPFLIRRAFMFLDQSEVVLGPAKDGGYYLLGLVSPMPFLFTEMAWSTPVVLPETIRRLDAGYMTYELLPVLSDVDHVRDLPHEKRP